jgi:rhodanese-related sulfurtransferase
MIAGKFFRALLFALLSAGIVTALYYARLLDAALVRQLAAAYTYIGYASREALAGSDDWVRHGLVALALLAAALFLPRLARRFRQSAGSAMIDIESLERRVAGGEAVAIVDVRGQDEYIGELGHIPGSMNIPLADLASRLTELQGLKHQPIVLVCRTDKRSAKAAELLGAAGFGRVEVLRGGMTLWNTRPRSKE